MLSSERKDAENRASELTAELTKTKTLLRNAQKDSVTLKKTLEVQTDKIFKSEAAVHKAEEQAKTIEQKFTEKLKEAVDAEKKAEAWNKVLETELKAAQGKDKGLAQTVQQAGLRGDVAQNKLKETDLLLAEALSSQSETRMELQDAQQQHEEDESKILDLQQKQIDTEEKLVTANRKAQEAAAQAKDATKTKETLEAVRLHALRRVAEDRTKQEQTEAKLAKAKLDAEKAAAKQKAAELKHAEAEAEKQKMLEEKRHEAEEKLEEKRREAEVTAKLDKVLSDAMKGGPTTKKQKRNKAGKVGDFVKTLKANMH